MKADVTILGIDPGLANVGYGVIRTDGVDSELVEFGAITTRPKQAPADRLLAIFNGLKSLTAKHTPEIVIVETLYFAKNTRSAMDVAQARGVALAAVALDVSDVREITPLQIKQALTGYGRADKRQIQRMTQTLLNLDEPPRPDHASDALAAALACAHSLRRRR
jgi:crossover junction endodeoxyribonuclease RuvC